MNYYTENDGTEMYEKIEQVQITREVYNVQIKI
jgi:hypothetical protein